MPAWPRAHKRAAIDGMLGISLQLDRSSLACPHVQAATRVALLAGRRVHDGQPRRDHLGLHHVGDQLLGPVRGAVAARRGSTRTEAHEF